MVFGGDDPQRTLTLAFGRGRDLLNFLRQQIRLVRFVLPPERGRNPHGDRTFISNEKFWRAVGGTDDPLRPNAVVRLTDFAVTEWLPRTPGVFHTPHAAQQRLLAMDYRMDERQFAEEARYHPGPRRSRMTDNQRNPTSVIYDPYGKSRMIEGGIGCVRLKDISLPDGRTWFMGATSSASVHEGIPIALFAPIEAVLRSSWLRMAVITWIFCRLIFGTYLGFQR